MIDEFKPCPSFPGYSASRAGFVRRDEWYSYTKRGKMRVHDAKVLSTIEKYYGHVIVDRRPVSTKIFRDDAWPLPYGPRPPSSYSYGRCVSVAEWIAGY
jgi:hypothetical protein